MKSKIGQFLAFWMLLGLAREAAGQCNPYFRQPNSLRPANYEIDVTLDDRTHSVEATQVIRFTNQSPVPIHELRLYMYLNAFKNSESTFLKGTSQIFGNPFSGRSADEWGWVDISDFRFSILDLKDPKKAKTPKSKIQNLKYVQPDDGNPNDQSVLSVPLDQPILPGETAVFDLKWKAQMPKTIARAGHSKDFYLFCHWFPQLGVFEKNRSGEWGWNCHQFMRRTEFYADFGVYDVRITTADKFVMGASGCLVSEKNNGNGTVTRHYHVEDVIGFAWSVAPDFTVIEDRWQDVTIRVLVPPGHEALGPRQLHALRFALDYLQKHVATYPYPSITVVDPPFHGLNSGLMEYPTLITTGTFYGMPRSLRMTESLVVHEFVHQYFMGILSSNEKEEPWLDEGFVTYFEDRIIDAAFGEKQALVDVLGYRFDNRELSRLEYTTMANPRENAVARPGWEFEDTNYKGLIYSKTATTLRTLQSLVGDENMDKILQAYFEKWKFRHPRGEDFMAVLREELGKQTDSTQAERTYRFFEKAIYDAVVLDYSVTQITNEVLPPPTGIFGAQPADFQYNNGGDRGQILSKIFVHRKGDWVFPVEILVTFEDGSTQTLHWSGEEGVKVFEIMGASRVVSAQLDPQQKLHLDLDLNNNSMTLKPDTAPLWKYAAKAIFWIQNLLQAASFLV